MGSSLPQATFLIMQCAEKAPTAILNIIKADIKRFAFEKLSFYEETSHIRR